MYKNRNPISATAIILTVLLEYIGLFNFNQFKQIFGRSRGVPYTLGRLPTNFSDFINAFI